MQAILSILLSWCTATRQFLGKLGTADCGFCVMHTCTRLDYQLPNKLCWRMGIRLSHAQYQMACLDFKATLS